MVQIISSFLSLAVLAGGIAFAVYDIRYRKVPNKALIPYTFLSIISYISHIILSSSPVMAAIDGAAALLVAGGILFVLALTTGGVGGGDIKFFAVLSVCMGMAGLIKTMFNLAILLLVFLVITFVIAKIKKKKWITSGPMIPFITAAAAPHLIEHILIPFI